MSNIAGFASLMIGIIIILLLFAFVYIWMLSAQKQKAIQYIGKEKKQKMKFKDRIWQTIFSFSKKLAPTASRIKLFSNENRDGRNLRLAGLTKKLSLYEFYGLRLTIWFLTFMGATAYFILGLPFRSIVLLVLPVAAFFLPNLWLKHKAKDRQEQISASMPDFLDIVSVSLQAGASLDGSLRQVANSIQGPLSDEIQQLNREISFGVQRETAYQSLIERNNSKELEVLIQSLVQGGELGVPVSRTFRVQADDLRANRGYNAKEQAAKASPKITIITTFTIVPSVFLLIVGLLFLNFLYNPGAFGLDILF